MISAANPIVVGCVLVIVKDSTFFEACNILSLSTNLPTKFALHPLNIVNIVLSWSKEFLLVAEKMHRAFSHENDEL